MLLLVEKSSKYYAFDYWQYLDSMVFWEGLVPTPDVIDAGHRNGVPVYGTLFFNWSNSIADQERFAEALKQDADGSFPIARKLVDILSIMAMMAISSTKKQLEIWLNLLEKRCASLCSIARNMLLR